LPTKPETSLDAVVEAHDLEVTFALQGSALARLLGRRGRAVKAIDGVNLALRRGEVLGLVGESGSGKTTLGRAFLGLVPATGGSITYHGRNRGDVVVSELGARDLRALRTSMQMVFQDPGAALNPGMTIEEAIGHPLVIHRRMKGAALRAKVCEALEKVGLSPVDRYLSKYPADLSGGQKQRAVIARAIILEPEVLIADEPVSMLDMSVRAKILQLMLDLKDQLGLTYVYITHDLASAKYVCDRIAIMYLGRIVEIGPTEEIFDNPRHPYTKALLKAIPEPDPDRMVPRDLPRGEIPDAAVPPLGCSFHPRCPVAVDECGWESRDLRTLLEEHWTRNPGATFDAERDMVGDLDKLDKPELTAHVGTGDAQGTRALFDRIRSENPDEPFWRGVSSIEEDGTGVHMTFHEPHDPALRPAGGVEVACVLYPDERENS
jgi:oligopeptide/dipeptide ABC transporter ATP-binding protein